MKKQREWLEELIRLQEENPDAEIIFCGELDTTRDYGYTIQSIYKIKIEWHYITRNYDHLTEGEVEDYITDCNSELSEDEIDELIQEAYRKLKKYICVFTGFSTQDKTMEE